jgi:putative intracellular protease/amidase
MQRRTFILGILATVTAVSWAAVRADEQSVPLRVAIYNHSDGTAKAPRALMKFLTDAAGFKCREVKPDDVRDDCLKDFDVLIVPGGSGSKQAEKLEPVGREKIVEFVRKGHGYVGICAGSYLATNDYTWSLGLLNAKVLDRAHWARGTGPVKVTLTPAGKAALGEKADELDVYYGQGPLLAPGGKAEPAAYEPLATFATEIAKNGAPKGVMPGTTAIARGTFGAGRVICFSPHPEVSGGPNHLVAAGVKWAGGR